MSTIIAPEELLNTVRRAQWDAGWRAPADLRSMMASGWCVLMRPDVYDRYERCVWPSGRPSDEPVLYRGMLVKRWPESDGTAFKILKPGEGA